MFSMRNRIRIDSLARIILICALIAVTMNLVFVSVLKAEIAEKALDKKARIMLPQQDDAKPGDADDIGGMTKLDFHQESDGEGDHSGAFRSSSGPDTNRIERVRSIIYLIYYCIIVERTLLY